MTKITILELLLRYSHLSIIRGEWATHALELQLRRVYISLYIHSYIVIPHGNIIMLSSYTDETILLKRVDMRNSNSDECH